MSMTRRYFLSLTAAAGAAYGFGLGDVLKAVPGVAQGGGGQGGTTTNSIMNVVGTAVEAGKASTFTMYDEYMVGEEITAKMLGTYKLAEHKGLISYLNGVGHTIALASRMPNHYNGIRFILLDAPSEINAFAAPGGFVMVTTGMLKFLKNEEELAVILGHEMGHLELEHGIGAIKSANNAKVTGAVKDAVVDAAGAKNRMVAGLAGDLFGQVFESIEKGYSVDLESEADKKGMELAHSAGYSAAALPVILNRFKTEKNSYGGANYPVEREKDAKKVLKSLSGSLSEEAIAFRTQRYQRALDAAKL